MTRLPIGEIARQLRSLATCDVADALRSLKYPHGGFLSGLRMYSPDIQRGDMRMVGPAFTVKFVSVTDKESPSPTKHHIDCIPEGAVVFLSAPPNQMNAIYGGLMSRRAKKLGAVGTVIDGRVRDLPEHRMLEYPIFANDVGTTAGAEVCRPSAVNVPVALNSTLQRTTIHPGDWIHGDVDGLVCIPKHLLEDVLKIAPELAERDRKVAEEIENGMSIAEAFKKHRSHQDAPGGR
ncbi:RraA-like protein [Meredithblackwellia eburnea MCA 4105]